MKVINMLVAAIVTVAAMYLFGVLVHAFVELSSPVFSVYEWSRSARFFFVLLTLIAVFISVGSIAYGDE